MGQKVTELGYDLPDPYGVSVIGAYIKQALVLEDLQISTDGGPYVPIDFVTFAGVEAEDVALEAKIDAWLFPFLNVFAIAGGLEGKGQVPFSFNVEDALDFLGLGDLCPEGPLRPPFCDQTVNAEADPDYHGKNLGVGAVVAMGWKSYFITIPMTWVWSDINILSQTISSFNGEILIGRVFKLKSGKKEEAPFLRVLDEA